MTTPMNPMPELEKLKGKLELDADLNKLLAGLRRNILTEMLLDPHNIANDFSVLLALVFIAGQEAVTGGDPSNLACLDVIFRRYKMKPPKGEQK